MRPPVPPFTEETARQKVQAAEDAWNTRDPERVAAAYTEDSQWRNRDEFLTGRPAIVEFLRRKWDRELDYALRKDLWAFTDNRIAVRFQYESRDASGQWWRSYGNEQWEFDDEGYMRRREASINDVRSTSRTAASSGRAPNPSAAHRCRRPEQARRPRPRRSGVSSAACRPSSTRVHASLPLLCARSHRTCCRRPRVREPSPRPARPFHRRAEPTSR